MARAIIEDFPDTTGCAHSGVGLSSPSPRRIGNVEFGFCVECRCQIAFILDESGKPTGERRIVQYKEVRE